MPENADGNKEDCIFHILNCFDLKFDVTIDDFQLAIDEFTSHMQNVGLVESMGAIGRRQRHPIMDTDSERDQEYFFILSFRDWDQCDRAVDFITPHNEPEESIHNYVNSKITNAIFICWEDI